MGRQQGVGVTVGCEVLGKWRASDNERDVESGLDVRDVGRGSHPELGGQSGHDLVQRESPEPSRGDDLLDRVVQGVDESQGEPVDQGDLPLEAVQICAPLGVDVCRNWCWLGSGVRQWNEGARRLPDVDEEEPGSRGEEVSQDAVGPGSEPGRNIFHLATPEVEGLAAREGWQGYLRWGSGRHEM